MSSSREHKGRRKIFDVHFGPLHERPRGFAGLAQAFLFWFGSEEVVDLRRRIFNRPEIRLLGTVLLIVLLFVTIRQFLTRAEVVDFFPSTCLGTWENPQNAQGEPDLFRVGFSSPPLTASNSAVYAGDQSQIFCGGFLPPDYEPQGEIKNVGITLALQVSGEPLSGLATSTLVPTSELPESTSTDSGESTASSSEIIETPQPPDAEVATSTTSFLRHLRAFLIGFALAEETTSTSLDEPTTSTSAPEEIAEPETIIAPPIVVTLEPLATSSGAASTTDEIASPTSSETGSETESETISETVSETVIPPPPPDQRFLQVSYSVDGELWVEAGGIDLHNWSNFTFALPITSWDDLEKLQVRIEGIATTVPEPLPVTYLDGMLLEVHYEVLLPAQEVAESPPPPTQEKESGEKEVIFDARSTHTCRVNPFGQTVRRGSSLTYQISFKSSYFAAPFEVLMGDLPGGVSAALLRSSGVIVTNTDLTFNVSEDAQTGSFNVVVIYREQSQNGEWLPNFCQLNLIIE